MICKQCKKKIKEDDKWTQVGLSAVHGDCINKFIEDTLKKVKKKKRDDKKRMKQVRAESEKTKALKTAQASFNKYIRKRDEKLGCITCGKPVKFGDRNYHAGHFYTVGARPDLRFNDDNCFGQCADCNLFGGNSIGKLFDKAVKKRIGNKRYKELLKPRHNSLTLKYLKSISKKFNKKFRKL